METENQSHYRVVQYFDQWPLGRQRKILRENLTLDEARNFREKEDYHVPHEDFTIEDQNTDEEIPLKH